MIPAAFAVGPKEHLATIASSTFIEVYEKRDVGLMSVLRYILMDGCAAERQGRLVGIKANNKTALLRDVGSRQLV